MPSKKSQYEKWLIVPDLQLPYEDTRTLAAVEAYMADVAASRHPFDGWLQLGDFLDFNELSKYNEGYEASIKEDVHSTFQAGNRFLDRHEKLIRGANPKARMVLLQGNHDYRVEDYGRKYPHLAAQLDYARNLRLKERRVEWVRCWEDKDDLFRLGNAYFTHGHYTNQFHAKKMVEAYGVCIFYGHLHDVMEHPKVMRGNNKTIVGKSLGCMCRYDQAYLKGAPTNWSQAFSEFYVFPDGYFQEQTVRIFKHRFIGPQTLKVYQ